jgi:subtilisin family serine protease
MKKTILVLIAAIGLFSCKKLDAPREVPSDTSKANSKEVKFYNQEKRNSYPSHEKGVVLFKLKSNSALSRVAGKRSVDRVFTKAMEKSGDRGFYKARFADENKALSQLRNNPDVEWASLNYVETTQTTPDDPYWTDGSLYGLLHIGMPNVWQSGNFGNKQVVVGVIDEGIFAHEDLCANIWTNPYEQDNGIDDDGNGYIDDFHGWDWFNGDNEMYPGASHGTHVAGTIGAKGGNQVGVIGVNSNVTLISCKFLENFGYDSEAIKAIDYLIDLKSRHGINIKVTSNSWGGGGYNPGLFEAIERAKAADILFVAAAGNHSGNNDLDPSYPASYTSDNIIAVGASDWQNNKASFSCFGATSVDLFATGVGVISTVPNTTTHTSAYAYYSGTSMATPHVSGACALYAGVNPEANYQQIKAAILNSASKLPQLKGLCLGDATGGNFLNVSTFTGQTAEHQAPFYECPEINPDVNPPSIPQNFRIQEIGFDPREGAFYGGYINIQWERSTDDNGVAGYIFWRNDVPDWFLGGNNYTIAGLDTTGGIVWGWVHAQDSWGNVSGFSNSDTASWRNPTPPPPADSEPPSVPQGLGTNNVTISTINLFWSASSDNIGVTRYKINWRAVGGSWLENIVTGTATLFDHLSVGTTYEFNVQAGDAAGNWSVPSTTVSATTLNPEPPPPTCTINSTINATAQSTIVTLTWNINVGSCTVTSTRLERKKGGNGAFTAIAFDPTSPYQDNVGNPGQYTYRLRIVTSDGQTGFSNERTIQVKKK